MDERRIFKTRTKNIQAATIISFRVLLAVVVGMPVFTYRLERHDIKLTSWTMIVDNLMGRHLTAPILIAWVKQGKFLRSSRG